MSITIGKAVPADAAALVEYLKQVGGETDNLTFGVEGLPITAEEEAAYIAQLENSQDRIMLVAKEQGKIIGNANLNRLPRRLNHRGDLGLSVIREYWNRGVGSQLLKGILNFARENDFHIVELQVRSDNSRAIHLYEKYGFQKLCTYPDFLKVGDQFTDADYMYLKLK